MSWYILTCGEFGLLASVAASISLKKLTIIAMIGGIIVAYFVPNNNVTLLFAMFAIFGLFLAMPMVTIRSMLMEAG